MRKAIGGIFGPNGGKKDENGEVCVMRSFIIYIFPK
jgi:hypothetical protein